MYNEVEASLGYTKLYQERKVWKWEEIRGGREGDKERGGFKGRKWGEK